jgi:hypothetical protein
MLLFGSQQAKPDGQPDPLVQKGKQKPEPEHCGPLQKHIVPYGQLLAHGIWQVWSGAHVVPPWQPEAHGPPVKAGRWLGSGWQTFFPQWFPGGHDPFVHSGRQTGATESSHARPVGHAPPAPHGIDS